MYQSDNAENEMIQQYSNCKYEDLQNFSEQIGLNQIVVQIQQDLKMDWKKQIQAIYYLRVIIKFNQGQINNMFQAFGQQLIGMLDKKQPTHLEKILLILIKEVFIKSSEEQINPKIITHIIPYVIGKLQQNEKTFLKQQAQQTVQHLIQNCSMQYELYELLCKLSMDKNHQMSEQAIKLLAQLIQQVGTNFINLQNQSLQVLIQTLQVIVSGKRPNEQSYACQILEYIHQLVGNDGFNNMVQNLLPQDQQTTLIQSIKDLTNKKNIQQNYKQIKQQDKENIKQVKRQSMANIIQAKRFNTKIVNDPNFIDLTTQNQENQNEFNNTQNRFNNNPNSYYNTFN